MQLPGARLAIGLVVNVGLGALVTAGVGSWAPSLVLVSLLGMEPRGAFPVMMGSAAYLMPVASLKVLVQRRYDQPAALGLAVGGIPAGLLAGLIVQSLPLDAVRWVVLVVLLYAAVTMLRSLDSRERASTGVRA